MAFYKSIHTNAAKSKNCWVKQFETAREPGEISGYHRFKIQISNGDLICTKNKALEV